MYDWQKCVAKNNHCRFEYYSQSKSEWIPFPDIQEDHFKNIIRKVIREDTALPFRITFLDQVTNRPIGGQYINLIMEPTN